MLSLLLAAQLLVFRGNVALVEDVYRSVLDLPAATKATPANARMVQQRLSHFLRQAGYQLASVQTHVQGEQIVVDIDEGRLDKIIFVGGGAFETLRLRLDLHIHDDVFNKPELERQLKALAGKLGLSDFAYEVVPVPNVKAPRVQLEDIEPLEELSLGLVRPGRPYELHILVQPGVFRPGISPELEVDSLEGGGVGATYHSGRLLFQDDRFQLGGRVAGAIRQRLEDGPSYVTFTRALGTAEYDAPALGGVLRPSIQARVDLTDRQRPDLNLESFEYAALEAGVQLLLVPDDYVRASIGAGGERRLLFNAQSPTNVQPLPGPQYSVAHDRPFAEAGLTLVLDPESLRRDRHHQLNLGARMYGPPHPGDEGALHLFLDWQKMWPVGWNEIWASVHALSRSGFVLFAEEESIGDGDLLRGPFGIEYARRAAGLDLEFRYSLLRDVFKLGVFHHGAAYGRLDRTRGTEKLALADAMGLGVHALIIDEFQLDAYFGVGFASGGQFDKGAALAIRQAF
ncbi:MAG TPA: hypothetical protein VLW85_19750 [Myxococcales bacterium]|nr:hypothetical protein [Myxococcales bacterium]